jgi:tRNA(fMet)-specific endonuclease VapC
MNYLLDTNIVSELVKPKPDKGVMEKCMQHEGFLAIGAPIWHELQFGCYRMPMSRKRELLEIFLEEVVCRNLPILPYDEHAARWHAAERARLIGLGQTPSFVDGQIAAIAATNGLTLITRNIDDFQIFSGLKWELWHDTPLSP